MFSTTTSTTLNNVNVVDDVTKGKIIWKIKRARIMILFSSFFSKLLNDDNDDVHLLWFGDK